MAYPASSMDAASPCPFCPGSEDLTPREVDAVRPEGSVADTPGWRARAFPSRYPVLGGAHEIILHSPDHNAELEHLGHEDLEQALELWRRRIAAHLGQGAAAATLIVNRGAGAGASLAHPHSQLLATPFVPRPLEDASRAFRLYHDEEGACLLCDEIERAEGRLVIGGDVALWVPEAPRFEYETWLAPADHQGDIREARMGLAARALRRALVATSVATDRAPLNLWLHVAPAGVLNTFHWYIQIAPRLTGIGGLELGADISVVVTTPEEMAASLRDALPST
jgi:UDPglucose--hexose-1-phosphate uridylyltransferase